MKVIEPAQPAKKGQQYGWPLSQLQDAEISHDVLGQQLLYRVSTGESGRVSIELWNWILRSWEVVLVHENMWTARRGLIHCKNYFPDAVIFCAQHGCSLDLEATHPCPDCWATLPRKARSITGSYPPPGAELGMQAYQALTLVLMVMVAVMTLFLYAVSANAPVVNPPTDTLVGEGGR